MNLGKDRIFSDLSSDEVQEIVKLYYSGNRIDLILEKFRLSMRPSELVTHFPPLIHPEDSCERCETSPLHSKRRSRSVKGDPLIYCPHCGHEEWNSYCRCTACEKEQELGIQLRQQAKETEEQELRKKLSSYIYSCNTAKPFSPQELDLRTRVYLSALIKSRLSEQGLYLNTLLHDGQSLSPTNDMDLEVLRALYKSGIIHLHIGNGIDAFTMESGEIKSFFLQKVFWKINKANFRHVPS